MSYHFTLPVPVSRSVVESQIETLIALLDALDGDADLEADGDEQDHNFAEDDFCDHSSNLFGHPGCPLADPGGCEHDGREPDH